MISATLPLHVKSTANERLHWATKAERARMHRAAAKMALGRRPAKLAGPVVVTLTRQAPRELDDDNWVSAAKNLRDGVADWLGVSDRDKRVAWVYRQARGLSCVRIDVEVVPHG